MFQKCHNLAGGVDATDIWRVEAGDAAKQPTVHQMAQQRMIDLFHHTHLSNDIIYSSVRFSVFCLCPSRDQGVGGTEYKFPEQTAGPEFEPAPLCPYLSTKGAGCSVPPLPLSGLLCPVAQVVHCTTGCGLQASAHTSNSVVLAVG